MSQNRFVKTERAGDTAREADTAEETGGKPVFGALKKAAKCVIFTGILFLILVRFANVVRQVDFRYNKNMFPSFYEEPENTIDIITIGSSADYQYMNTPVLYEKFGYTSYNLATALQPPAATAFIMTEAEKTQNPQLYIVEVREFLHLKEDKRVRALYCVTDSMDLSLNKWNMIAHSYPSLWERITGFLDITKYHGSWAGITKKTMKYSDNRIRNVTKCWNGKTTVRPFEAPKDGEITEQPLYEHNEAELIYLLEECKKKGREVLFVATPFVHTDTYKGRALTLKKIVESYGYRFLDLTGGSEYGIDYQTDFYNANHVNQWGAEKVTIALGEYIKKEYNIDAQHTDAVREDWDRYAAKNRTKLEEPPESANGNDDDDEMP